MRRPPKKIKLKTGRTFNWDFKIWHGFLIASLRLISSKTTWDEKYLNTRYDSLGNPNIHNIDSKFFLDSKEMFNRLNISLPLRNVTMLHELSEILYLNERKGFYRNVNSFRELKKRRKIIDGYLKELTILLLQKRHTAYPDLNRRSIQIFTILYRHKFLSKPPSFIKEDDYNMIMSTLKSTSDKDLFRSAYLHSSGNLYRLDDKGKIRLRSLKPIYDKIVIVTKKLY